MKKKDPNLSKKLDDYKKQYEQKENEWKEIISNLEKEKENDIQRIKTTFEEKKKKAGLIQIDKTQVPSQHLESLRASNDVHAAVHQETEELNQHHFAVNREMEARIQLLDKQCQTKIDQTVALDDEYIAKQKKKRDNELAAINREYEKLKLYIERLNRHF